MWEELINKQKKKNKQNNKHNEQLSKDGGVEQQQDCGAKSSVILRRAVSDATVTPKTRSKYSLQTSIKAEKKKNKKKKKKKGSTSSSIADDTSETGRTRGNSKMEAASNFFNKLSKSFHHISPRSRTATLSTVSTNQAEPSDNRDSIFIPDNPWGDQLGGANPLFQPLMTRSRKPKKIFEQQQNAESKLDDCTENGLLSENQFQRSPSLRIPTASNFTYKSQKYRSISAKIFQPSESHRNLAERLLQLRKLLKEKNKELESIVLKPINSSESNAKH
ncbi:Anion exchange protein [Trichinella spiralis]|uniref:Anion exchange protein n=1 Tax=Trichinella spiralis TaxID=6334 RepID=A0ABR3KTG8_TRISP